jgi:hypothetical protein
MRDIRIYHVNNKLYKNNITFYKYNIKSTI